MVVGQAGDPSPWLVAGCCVGADRAAVEKRARPPSGGSDGSMVPWKVRRQANGADGPSCAGPGIIGMRCTFLGLLRRGVVDADGATRTAGNGCADHGPHFNGIDPSTGEAPSPKDWRSLYFYTPHRFPTGVRPDPKPCNLSLGSHFSRRCLSSCCDAPINAPRRGASKRGMSAASSGQPCRSANWSTDTPLWHQSRRSREEVCRRQGIIIIGEAWRSLESLKIRMPCHGALQISRTCNRARQSSRGRTWGPRLQPFPGFLTGGLYGDWSKRCCSALATSRRLSRSTKRPSSSSWFGPCPSSPTLLSCFRKGGSQQQCPALQRGKRGVGV